MTGRYVALRAAVAAARDARKRLEVADAAVREARISFRDGSTNTATVTEDHVQVHYPLRRDQFAALVRDMVADGVLTLAELIP